MKIKRIIVTILLILINNLARPQDYVPIRILTFNERIMFKMKTNDTISCIAQMICTFNVKFETSVKYADMRLAQRNLLISMSPTVPFKDRARAAATYVTFTGITVWKCLLDFIWW